MNDDCLHVAYSPPRLLVPCDGCMKNGVDKCGSTIKPNPNPYTRGMYTDCGYPKTLNDAKKHFPRVIEKLRHFDPRRMDYTNFLNMETHFSICRRHNRPKPHEYARELQVHIPTPKLVFQYKTQLQPSFLRPEPDRNAQQDREPTVQPPRNHTEHHHHAATTGGPSQTGHSNGTGETAAEKFEQLMKYIKALAALLPVVEHDYKMKIEDATLRNNLMGANADVSTQLQQLVEVRDKLESYLEGEYVIPSS